MFLKLAICSIALLILGETCHLKGRDMVMVWRTVLLLSGYNCDSTHQHYDVTQFESVLWRHTMHELVMNIHYKTWIAQGRFTNMILTPSKQWGVCDNFWTLTPVWIYQWLWNDAQSLTLYGKGCFSRSSIKFTVTRVTKLTTWILFQ